MIAYTYTSDASQYLRGFNDACKRIADFLREAAAREDAQAGRLMADGGPDAIRQAALRHALAIAAEETAARATCARRAVSAWRWTKKRLMPIARTGAAAWRGCGVSGTLRR